MLVRWRRSGFRLYQRRSRNLVSAGRRSRPLANVCAIITSLSCFPIALRELQRNRNYHIISVARFMGAALNDELDDHRVPLYVGIQDRSRLRHADDQAPDGRSQELPPIFATRCRRRSICVICSIRIKSCPFTAHFSMEIFPLRPFCRTALT